MLSIFASERKRAVQNARNWLRLARKVYHYRRDLLDTQGLNELRQATSHLETLLEKKADVGRIKFASEQLDDVLRRHGGQYYSKSSLSENVEVFLVAAILALGIRTFFFQPFKIPTNSMWPTYAGMTHEIYVEAAAEPGPVRHAFRRVFYGASRVAIDSPETGPVRVPVRITNNSRIELVFSTVRGRRWFVLPAVFREYSVFVGSTPVTFRVPPDFQVDEILRESLYPDEEHLHEAIAREIRRGNFVETGGFALVETRKNVERDERVLSFDILTGDQLFVDRFSYHFIRPKIGSGIVFRTGTIEGLFAQDDKYYIKRLVGKAGDQLEIREPVLYRNGSPISNSPVFEYNADLIPPYRGYVGYDLLREGRIYEVPDDSYFALGDNSHNSFDSRSWGSIPKHAMIGRPVFIYYPFSYRWGRAK